ncbi:hypothetical protein Pan216_27420 [Planctomycetes bacterium Pan216]|uniref:Putative restriction endonuclease domain-containing protein n=1 Tax=Kolteria novifilia TaxID=2527975 RepID=A0A518B4I1_9BACT|nr:hypothetical protein Pan216_27420 [Planctomycetes bacterium Pan216]
MSTETRPITAEEAVSRYGDERWELVDGEIRLMTPAGFNHGLVVGAIYRSVDAHNREVRPGHVVTGEPGFYLSRNPDTVRAPDVAFVTKVRLAAAGQYGLFFPGPPDLAVEFISPDDRSKAIDEKTRCWLEHGTREVWLVNPFSRTVTL